MAVKQAPPINPNTHSQRRYTLYLLALLGYITRQVKQADVIDLMMGIPDKLLIFQHIQKEHEIRVKRAPHIVEEVLGEAQRASVTQMDNVVEKLAGTEGAPFAFDLSLDINNALASAVAENVALVRNLSQGYLDKIQRVVLEYNASGKAGLSEELQKINGISKNRAQLIARDQLNKLHGETVRIKAQAAGSIGYQWHNMKDERVRGNPKGKYPRVPSDKNHWVREGKYFLWRESADVQQAPDGTPYKQPPSDGIPGHAINCRCVSAPVFNFLLKNNLQSGVPLKDTNI